MCGFVGCWRDASIEAVASLAGTLGHRGPDGEGVYLSPDRAVAFAHRRLAIVDLVTGDQPMSNENGTVWMPSTARTTTTWSSARSWNGRATATGRRRTPKRCRRLEEWGDEFVSKLNGEFAFVLHDEGRRRCLLGRDGLGIRPLFYTQVGRQVYFASEIKALVGVRDFLRSSIRPRSTRSLSLRYSFGEQSMLRGVRRLPPGTTLRLDEDTLSPRRYWEVPIEPRPWSEADAIGRLDELLRDSVRMRLMSDVPVGMYPQRRGRFRSDPGLAGAGGAEPIRTFSIGFDLPLDERRSAAAVAETFGRAHGGRPRP